MLKYFYKMCDSLYVVKNFQKDFLRVKNLKFETKTDDQIKFEKYLCNKGVVICDYHRILIDYRYFDVLAKYINTTNKKTVLYSIYKASYISNTAEFTSYKIPKNPTERQFNNIYNYLFCQNEVECVECKCQIPFYFCIDCGVYTCRRCVLRFLKSAVLKTKEIMYLDCRGCGKWSLLYELPLHYDI